MKTSIICTLAPCGSGLRFDGSLFDRDGRPAQRGAPAAKLHKQAWRVGGATDSSCLRESLVRG